MEYAGLDFVAAANTALPGIQGKGLDSKDLALVLHRLAAGLV